MKKKPKWEWTAPETNGATERRMLPLSQCLKILNNGEGQYTESAAIAIREHLYHVGDLAYEGFALITTAS